MTNKLLILALAIAASGTAIAGDAYSALDADNSGAISLSEAAALPGLTEQFNVLDVDVNGKLSAEEFAKFEMAEAEAPYTPQ
ncbi:MAG: calmodulin [Gammaproteobacteria bacterium]|nr:calmodulin [Gammaproteobacteria bacterium]